MNAGTAYRRAVLAGRRIKRAQRIREDANRRGDVRTVDLMDLILLGALKDQARARAELVEAA